MELLFKEHKTKQGELLIYTGNPDLKRLDELVAGPGDIWHSSFEQGYKNAFPDLVYFCATFWWYINDFDGLGQCVSWRINPHAFAVRKKVWETLGGFDTGYDNIQMQALDFGFNALRMSGVVSLYSKGLFEVNTTEQVVCSVQDRYLFFRKNFKIEHSLYLLFRKGFWKFTEWDAFLAARSKIKFIKTRAIIASKSLEPIQGNPSVSYIIPTMFRQDYTVQLLDDLSQQTYLPKEVIVVDATPEEFRDAHLYARKAYPFKLVVHWQTTKGSCRARNEAIESCTGGYIIFGDDDIRIPSDFIENHIRFLQTYNTGACNGLDIRAAHHTQGLEDLALRLKMMGDKRWTAGVSSNFSNANSCVKRAYVDALVGNDINYDGGYGEDSDFGLSLVKMGVAVLQNPFSVNLHLKPPSGGYRFWGSQAKIIGKKRRAQPWELDKPVKWIKPVPSPTIMYQFYKHFTPKQRLEYKYRHFFLYLFKNNKWTFLFRLLNVPYKLLQFKRSQFYASALMKLGVRYK